MEDLGAPISYLMLERGASVYAHDGEKLGRVKEIRADTQEDIFDGIVVDHLPLLRRDDGYIPAERIDEIFERGVLLKADA